MKRTLSFLFLGGAKRVGMGRLLLSACADRGFEGRIFSYELDSFCPIAEIGTAIVGKRWSDPSLMSDLQRVVRQNEIDIVVPFVDRAVEVAARLREADGSVFAPCGSAVLSELMFDKVAAAELFEKHGLPVPETYRPGQPLEKLIAKPRHGSASKGIVLIDRPEDLNLLDGGAENYLIQQRIDRRRELSADCYASVADGRIYACSVRERLEVSGGEAVRTRTVDDVEARELVCRTIRCLNLRGAVTVQLIRDRDTQRLMIMEVNPRLGGACVASVYAGADIPGLIIDEALGRELKLQQSRADVTTVRYLADYVFE